MSARQELRDRGETPQPLSAELEGSEVAGQTKRFEIADASQTGAEPDAKAALPRDARHLLRVEPVVAPSPFAAGQSARVYLRFVPDARRKVKWDDEAGPLRVWLQALAGFTLSNRLLTAGAEADGAPGATRSLELEIQAAGETPPGAHRLTGYAVYWVCDGPTAECTLLRQDFVVEIELRPKVDAPRRRR